MRTVRCIRTDVIVRAHMQGACQSESTIQCGTWEVGPIWHSNHFLSVGATDDTATKGYEKMRACLHFFWPHLIARMIEYGDKLARCFLFLSCSGVPLALSIISALQSTA